MTTTATSAIPQLVSGYLSVALDQSGEQMLGNLVLEGKVLCAVATAGLLSATLYALARGCSEWIRILNGFTMVLILMATMHYSMSAMRVIDTIPLYRVDALGNRIN